jgi:hypothetical protein
MQDPKQIWEFGRWIARRDPGKARLSWSGGEIVLGVRQGRIHSVEGLPPGKLAGRLHREPAGQDDLLAEAKSLGQTHGVPETQAMGAAKEILQEAFHEWLLDPAREFTVEDEEPVEVGGATISITHAVVELVLADTEQNVSSSILPDDEVVLQRSSRFIELYAPLRLSEEADLIVAGITGSASASDIARDSSHGPDEVVRLVAALVATGVLEASEPVISGQDLDWPVADLADDEPTRRAIPVWMLGAAAAALLLVIAIIAWAVLGGDEAEVTAVESGDWGVVVEMGCEPQDLQRMLRKKNLEPKMLRTIDADPATGDVCFRLVWGRYETRATAEEAMADLPPNLVEEGFQPHVFEVPQGESGEGPEAGE